MNIHTNSDERWSDNDEVKDKLRKVSAKDSYGGPILLKDGTDYYAHDNEGHVLYLGQSGTGKSFMGTMNLVASAIIAGHSLVVVDPKGELEKKTSGIARRKGLTPIVIDFRNPSTSVGWNPLGLLCDMYHSKKAGDREYAYSLTNDLMANLAKLQRSNDGFWEISSSNLVGGIVSGLISMQKSVRIKDVTNIISKGNQSINKFYKSLPPDSVAAIQLSQYANAAGEELVGGTTKASIVTSALACLSVFNKNEALSKMLCLGNESNFSVSSLKGNSQFIVYIIIPDEIKSFETIAGIMCSQISMHLIKEAENYPGSKLPTTVHFVCEEFGNLGKAMVNTPHLISAGRSRGLRMHLVLQSLSQLYAVFNKGDAETILSNISINILYRTNNFDTLVTFSQRCGERSIAGRKEALVSAVQLGALKVAQALIMIEGKIKYITVLPSFDEFLREVVDYE